MADKNERYRIRLRVNWSGELDGERISVKKGDTIDVPRDYMHALCFEREIADPVPVSEILEKR